MTKETFLVGIGASAGGLKQLQRLVEDLPTESNMAYIIVQHLDPTHDSLLRELLSKKTSITVEEARHNSEISTNTIYVIPPDAFLEVEDNQLKLTEAKQEHGMRKAIDHLFRSIAERSKPNCAGIILSGAGSDGAAGLRAIKAAGGLTLVQDPDDAEHSGMPQSAVETGVVDKVLPTSEMASVLAYYSTHPFQDTVEEPLEEEVTPGKKKKSKPRAPIKDGELPESLHELTALLETHENFDLRQYKPTTVQRRVARRMSLTAHGNYEAYIDHLRENEAERGQLTRDLLINVTDFFRDKKAFNWLEKNAILKILEEAKKSEEIRIWVAGCATGEEAYSLAILLLENAATLQKRNTIKIFATDIDDDAIAIARTGIYTSSVVGEVPKHYIERYFTKLDDDHYKIQQRVRDLVSFAKQNVVTDPPFSRMHLISCRNLLIYLRKEVQETVMQSFYFSLKDKGFLFLGSSETVGRESDLFKAQSKKWRLYKKILGHDSRVEHYKFLTTKKKRKHEKPAKQTVISAGNRLNNAILNAFQPPTLIVSQDGRLLYKFKDLSPFLVIPSGEPRHDFLAMVPAEMRAKIRSTLFRVRKDKDVISFISPVAARTSGTEVRPFRVTLAPVELQDETEDNAVAISFDFEDDAPLDAPASTDGEAGHAIQKLETELAETREDLQNTIEELDTNSEELKAAHEETLSTNEELQSTNEELEASAEELRSLNEELSTVNSQLKDKVDELQRANDDVENFVASTDIATIFLDPELKIKRYTSAAEKLLRMGPRDLGRPITALGRDLIDKDVPDDSKVVLESFASLHKEVRNHEGKWFIRRITPYRTEDRRIEGVVVSFQDVNELKQLSRRAEMREKQQSVIAALGLLALHEDSLDELMQQTVRQVANVLDVEYCKILKYQPEQKKLKMMAGVGWQPGLVGNATVPADMDSQGGYTLTVNQPVIVTNLAEEERFQGPALLTDHQVVSGLSCVINHTDPPYGVFGIHTREYREFTEDDAHFIVAIANLISYAVKNANSQQQIRESEFRLQLARSAASLGIHDWDVTTDKVQWDDRIYEIWGIDPSTEITYEHFENGLHPDDRDRVNAEAQASLLPENGGFFQSEYRVINQKTGRLYWINANGKITFENGKAVRLVGTVADITAIKESKRVAQDSKDRLEAALAAANLGTWSLDPENKRMTRHHNLSSLMGLDREQVTESLQSFANHLHEDDRQPYLESISRCLEDGQPHEVELRVVCPDGTIIWVKDKGHIVEKNGQKFVTGAMADISRIKEIEQEATTANRHKSEFLAMMSHEIRTPLNAVVGITNILRDMPGLPAEKVTELYTTLATSAEALLALINDILDISKIDSGILHLEEKPFALDELMQSIADLTRQKIKSPAVTLKLETDAIAGKQFIGDENRIRQIFLNLTTNAAKFTNKGRIEFSVKEGADETLIVTVSDTGIGIPEESQGIIFDRFTQTDVGSAREYEGTGLGLAIVKSLVEAMGGTVKLESKIDHGSTFTVKLPLKTAGNASAKHVKGKASTAVSAAGPVLLVEDKQENILVAELMVERQGYDVETTDNGHDALTAIEKNHGRYCAMLLDIRMPGLDGYEVMKRVRALEKQQDLHELPIIAITANALVDDRQKCLDAGANAYLSKPFDPEELFELMQAHCLSPETKN